MKPKLRGCQGRQPAAPTPPAAPDAPQLPDIFDESSASGARPRIGQQSEESLRIHRADSGAAGRRTTRSSLAADSVFSRYTPSRIIAYNDSPDVGFDASVNPYRGCEHGCVYCYARPTHEYLGFSSGLDFETKIMVKEDAPELLRKELSSPKWKPQVLALSGITDCYQPVEKKSS